MREQTRRYIDEVPSITVEDISPIVDRFNKTGEGCRVFDFRDSAGVLIRLKQTCAGSIKWASFKSWDDETDEINSGVITYSLKPCRYGGSRLYLNCPATKRNYLALYFIDVNWVSRNAGNLHYRSQSEVEIRRLQNEIRKIKAKMRGNGLTWSIKPKGMWWKTYSALGKRLCEKADQLSAAKTRYILQLGARDLNKTQRGRTVSDENTAFEDELSLFQAE